jgi:hypothetical protein
MPTSHGVESVHALVRVGLSDRDVFLLRLHRLVHLRHHAHRSPDEEEGLTIPRGYCQCGCGQKTKPYAFTAQARGVIKGQPARYLVGHAAREATRLKTRWIEDESGCWIWQGARIWSGYGKYKNRGAHRAVYEELVGPVHEGKQLDHVCQVRACVNPAHLRVVTPAENTRQRSSMKLTATDVAEIRRLAGSMTHRAIGEQFGVGQAHISRILKGERWGDSGPN